MELIEAAAETNLAESLRLGNIWSITVARHIYADIPLMKGDYELSEQRYKEAAKSALELGNELQADLELMGMAMSLAGQGRHEKGLRVFGATMAKFEDIGLELVTMEFWVTCINRTLGKAMEIVGPEQAQSLHLEGRQMGFEKAIEYAFNADMEEPTG